MTPKIRQVEYYRLWAGATGDSGTWDTDFVDVPGDTPNDKMAEAAKKAIDDIEWTDNNFPVITGIYHYSCDDENAWLECFIDE